MVSKHTNIASDAVALAGQQQTRTSGTSSLASRDKIGEIAAVTAQIISLSSGAGKHLRRRAITTRPISLTDISSVTPALTSNGWPIKLSDYPLPASNNGLFCGKPRSEKPVSTVTNPKLTGLGQLDSSLFNDSVEAGRDDAAFGAAGNPNNLYLTPRSSWGRIISSARLNLRPEYYYRFLGDAAFDTRYVSNQILNQTGSRYVNGVGSTLSRCSI